MININAKDVKDNPIVEFNEKYALVTARKKDGTFNTCTIGWGTIGKLWNKDVLIVYVKPIRFTDEFLDEDDYFSVTFFNENHLNDLKICGTMSGRNCDKIAKTSLKPLKLDNGIIYEDFRRAYICKKIYKGKFCKNNFVDSKEIIDKYYLDEECHNIYIGEIIQTFEE